MTKNKFLEELRVHIARKHKGDRGAAADHWGFSRQYLGAVMLGNKLPNKAILKDMGLEQIKTVTVTYRKKESK